MTAMPAWTAAGRKLPVLLACVVLTLAGGPMAAHPQSPQTTADSESPRAIVDKYCLSCHSPRPNTARFDLETLKLDTPGGNAASWEKGIARLRTASMPPPGRLRLGIATYHAVAGRPAEAVDRAREAKPDPGRMAAVHRL